VLKYKKKKKKKKKAKWKDIAYEADNQMSAADLQNDNPFFQNSMNALIAANTLSDDLKTATSQRGLLSPKGKEPQEDSQFKLTANSLYARNLQNTRKNLNMAQPNENLNFHSGPGIGDD